LELFNGCDLDCPNQQSRNYKSDLLLKRIT